METRAIGVGKGFHAREILVEEPHEFRLRRVAAHGAGIVAKPLTFPTQASDIMNPTYRASCLLILSQGSMTSQNSQLVRFAHAEKADLVRRVEEDKTSKRKFNHRVGPQAEAFDDAENRGTRATAGCCPRKLSMCKWISLLLRDPSHDRVELGEERRVTPFGRSDERGVEHCLNA
ncbi:MAG: hypothetical protein U1E87_04290 [Alphaproteobacteria bacterium]